MYIHRFIFAFLLLLPLSSGLAEPSFEVAYSPNGGATELVVKTIREARHSVRLAGYGFSSKPIAVALLAAHKRGVAVALVLDKSNATARYSAANVLANQGVPVRLDYAHNITHDKFIVVDDQLVETGSFNYTAAAEHSNAENVVVICGKRSLAAAFLANWQTLWEESEPLASRS